MEIQLGQIVAKFSSDGKLVEFYAIGISLINVQDILNISIVHEIKAEQFIGSYRSILSTNISGV